MERVGRGTHRIHTPVICKEFPSAVAEGGHVAVEGRDAPGVDFVHLLTLRRPIRVEIKVRGIKDSVSQPVLYENQVHATWICDGGKRLLEDRAEIPRWIT